MVLDTEHRLDVDHGAASGDEPGDGGVWMISNFVSTLLTAVGVGAGAVEPFQRIGLKQGHARSHPPP
jgi:hypothetical protein